MPKKQHLIEIERKFLVTSDAYKTQAVKHYEIIQGYLAKGEGRTIRVRIRDNEAFLTIKGGAVKLDDPLHAAGNGLARFEWEHPIDANDAKALLQLALPCVIEKTRWIIPATTPDNNPSTTPLVWEVDEFHGRLEGRTLAEIELDYEDQPFLKPDFIGPEVTGQPQYYNANM